MYGVILLSDGMSYDKHSSCEFSILISKFVSGSPPPPPPPPLIDEKLPFLQENPYTTTDSFDTPSTCWIPSEYLENGEAEDINYLYAG